MKVVRGPAQLLDPDEKRDGRKLEEGGKNVLTEKEIISLNPFLGKSVALEQSLSVGND